MKNAYRNEWRKLRFHKKYTVFLVIGMILQLLSGVFGILLSKGFGFLSGSLIKLPLGTSITGSLSFFSSFYLPLLIFMGVSDLFVGEFSDQTIKTSLMRPVTRLKLYSAKLLAAATYCAGFLGILFCISLVFPLATKSVDSPVLVFQSLLGYIMTLIPLAVMISFAAFIAQVIKSGSLFMFLMILSLPLLWAVPLLFPFLQGALFYDHMNWFKLFIGKSPGFWTVCNALLVLCGTGAACYFAGTILFDKRDF